MEIPTQFCAKFHESSNRAHLWFGCEAPALIFVGTLSAVIVFSVPNRYGIAAAGCLLWAALKVLREMAKDDPRFITVHHRSQRYNRKFWTAKPIRAKRWRS